MPRRAKMTTLRVIGGGRAGHAFEGAFRRLGWRVDGPLGREADLGPAATGVDFLVLAVPDSAISAVADAVAPSDVATIVHLAGSVGPEALGRHRRRAAIHPLVSLTPDQGADRLAGGAWFGITADPEADRAALELVGALNGRVFQVPAERRALYHAAACIASNHLVALFGQVERLADLAGVPMPALLELAEVSLDNVARLGASGALTGPVSRGDLVTIERHRRALPAEEADLYECLASEAARVAGRRLPPPQR
jgi:predicted short-subunit dehydrogenase-like oxidoreductase (DUF2520 family)